MSQIPPIPDDLKATLESLCGACDSCTTQAVLIERIATLQEVVQLAADYGKTQFQGYRAMLVARARAALGEPKMLEPSSEINYIAVEIAKLRADNKALLDALKEYRATPDHRFCEPAGTRDGMPTRDVRCPLCKKADDLIEHSEPQ